MVADEQVRLVESMAQSAVVELAHLSSDEKLWGLLSAQLPLFKMYTNAPEISL
jgi:hypothetical protein